ncbi:NHL repeat-containing protein [Streptomyces sp. NPDC005727]|uniref:NHL repeat-containing protein n=1 Tax=Streptomyces sp. NPDC005727 TaxID=3157053 RepID=UPI003407CDFC
MTTRTPAAAAFPDGTIITAAGNGEAGFVVDGGPAAGTKLYNPHSVAVDREGNLYIADASNHRVRKVTPSGIITTVAGNGQAGFVSDGGPAVATKLYHPHSVAVDGSGNLYIADYSNHRVRKVTPDGIITTVAGNGQAGFVSDGGPAVATKLNAPIGVAVDGDGNVYIADYGNHRVRKVTPDGIITTVAGNGQAGFVSDGGPAVATKLNYPWGMAVDGDGNLYIADRYNHRVRKVTPNGIITTVAGNGVAGYIADGGPAVATTLHYPAHVAVDGAGNLYIGDGHNHRVRKVTPNGIITTVAGNGVAGYIADGGPAVGQQLYYPYGVAVAPTGDLYIGDSANHRVRKVFAAATMTPPPPPVADLYGELVLPVMVPRRQEFDLGARIHNRGPAIASGEHITVVLTLADGLESARENNGRRLTRTFPGTDLAPNKGSLDGVFRVRAVDTAKPGTYESTLEIQYGGDLNLKDNSFTLPVTVVVPEPVADERGLTIYQENIPEAAPGQSVRVLLRFVSPVGQPVNPGTITQRFTAPTGFAFSGRPTYTYPDTVQGAITGELEHEIYDSGRTLIIRDNPHLNTTDTDAGTLVYSLGLQAQPDAAPGLASDGSASIGRRAPVQILAKVTGAAAGHTVRIVQSRLDQARVRPGQQWAYPVVMTLTNTGQKRIGPADIVFTAPEGLWFTESRVMMSREGAAGETELFGQRSNGNRTLTLRGAALDLEPGKWAVLYPEMEIESDAAPGAVRVGIRVGTPPFATGNATVTIEA